jgi:hypothetical protein
MPYCFKFIFEIFGGKCYSVAPSSANNLSLHMKYFTVCIFRQITIKARRYTSRGWYDITQSIINGHKLQISISYCLSCSWNQYWLTSLQLKVLYLRAASNVPRIFRSCKEPHLQQFVRSTSPTVRHLCTESPCRCVRHVLTAFLFFIRHQI